MSVTIIIPARNEEKNISDSVKSLLNQTIKPLKIIIVLDRCTDNTEKVVNELMRNNKEIVKIVKDSTEYKKTFMKAFLIAESINVGLENAKPFSEFIMIVNADSVFSIDYVKESLEILDKDKKCGMVGYAHYSNISGSGYIIRSDILKKIGSRIKECAAEDTYLQFLVLELGYSIKKIKDSSMTLLRDRGEGSIRNRIEYAFSKGYASYTLGYSLGYEIMRSAYWMCKGKFSSFAIIVGFLYAFTKKTKKLDIANSDVIKKWQRERCDSIFSKI